MIFSGQRGQRYPGNEIADRDGMQKIHQINEAYAMRVIAGTARSLRLRTVKGDNTRPTTDRIKETLFNMISVSVDGASFLDLFGGSGAIGIEALSRGAREAVFVEKGREACACIDYNLKFTHLGEKGHLMKMDVMDAIRKLTGEHLPFDFIFMDPPYGKELEKKALLLLCDSGLCSTDTTIIVESDLETGFDYLEGTNLEVYRIKKYKTNKHTFIRMRNKA